VSVPLRDYVDLLFGYLRPQWRKAALLGVLLFASIGLQLLNPQVIRGFIDAATTGGDHATLVQAAAIFLAIALAQQGLAIASAYVGEDVGWTATNGLRADLAMHCLRLDLDFHNQRTPGEMIERIDGDVTALANFFSQFVLRVLGSGILLLGTLVLLMREDWRVGLALAFFTGVAIWLLNHYRDVAVAALADEREANARVFGFVEERLAGLDDVRSAGAGRHVMRGLTVVMRVLFHKTRRAWTMRAILELGTNLFFAIGIVIAMGMGGYLFLAGAITLGTAYLFFQYTEMLRGPIEQLTREMQDLQRATAGIARVRELLAIRRDVLDGPGADLPPGPLSVEMNGVGFGYGGDVPVLQDVSFRIPAGDVLGVVGRTGSGKTTLTRLLFRLYDAGEGTIRLGGRDIRDLTLAQLRRHVALVTQEVQLFQASVRDNLTFFDPDADDARIVSLIEELGLGDWLATLPKGLDTELGASGTGLSAGEGQLLAVARAFLTDPGLVILDEPSSRLDPATERLIERAIERLVRGRTAIVIAHRLATVEKADAILVMGDGRVLEHGAPIRLEADPTSHFARLLRAGHAQEVLV
jgi:ABC-type multidrug transport system fused ATPase/permease subunit